MDTYSNDRSRERSRSRSKSPIRRSGYGDSHRYGYNARSERRTRYRGAYDSEDRSGYHNDSRTGDHGGGSDRYSREVDDYANRRGYRENTRAHRYSHREMDKKYYGRTGVDASRYTASGNKGDFGPKLARELDSSYREKMNRNYENSIFIGNLTYDTTPDDLKDFFGKIGEVRRADIITSRGHHRGMGTVEFTNSENVDRAIRECDGAYIRDRAIFVRQDNPPPSEFKRRDRSGPPPLPKRSHEAGFEVFVAQLPFNVNWQELKDMFKPCGIVLHADVVTDRDGKSRGFGTVYMASKAEQLEAIRRWNGADYKGRLLDVKEGKGSSTRAPSSGGDTYIPKKPASKTSDSTEYTLNFDPSTIIGGGERSEVIYCENMPSSTTESDLYDLFGSIGPVIRAHLKVDVDGQFTNASVCQFETIDDAEICIKKLDKYSYGGHELKVSFAKF